MTKIEKKRIGAHCCPDCGSDNLSTEEKSEYSKEFYSVYFECGACGLSYDVQYDLVPAYLERFPS
jgi:transcription elongation factor Elf1